MSDSTVWKTNFKSFGMERDIKIVIYCLEWREAGRCCVGGSSQAAGTEQGGRWRGYCSHWTSHQLQGGRVNLVTPHFPARWQSELQPASQTLWMHRRELRNSGRNTGISSRHSGSSPCKCFYFPFCITCCFYWAVKVHQKLTRLWSTANKAK